MAQGKVHRVWGYSATEQQNMQVGAVSRGPTSRGGWLRGGSQANLELHLVPQDFGGAEHLNTQEAAVAIEICMDARPHGLGGRRPLPRRAEPEVEEVADRIVLDLHGTSEKPRPT